jgi:hypothetical protein
MMMAVKKGHDECVAYFAKQGVAVPEDYVPGAVKPRKLRSKKA